MSAIVLTANGGAILGPIAKVLGWLMNGIYVIMRNLFGIENVALAIVILTIVIYMLMLPLTIKQQKFSKLSQKMQPELNAIQAKYKNRKDQDSQALMQQETSLVYKKYGVSPMGSCIQLLIQMPILFALYRVFYNIPAYISSVKQVFEPLAEGIIGTEGYADTLAEIMTANKITTGSGLSATNVVEKLAGAEGTALNNYVIDILYKLPSTVWANFSESFPSLSDSISSVSAEVSRFNYFLGLNISDTPWAIMKTNWASKGYGFVILALMIPVLSYISQVISIKLSTANTQQANDQMSQQMKTMNTMMPLMSLLICFSVPVGLGIYWILSAVVRTIQMVIINKKIENMNLEEIIAKNEEKAKKEREKMGIAENQIREAAKMKTRKIESKANVSTSSENESKVEAAAAKKANAKAGSMAAKANMVKDFNERNTRK